MPFVFPSEKTVKSIELKSKDELFEMYMFEIGQYSKDEYGNTQITGPYIKSSELANNFKDWLKKKS